MIGSAPFGFPQTFASVPIEVCAGIQRSVAAVWHTTSTTAAQGGPSALRSSQPGEVPAEAGTMKRIALASLFTLAISIGAAQAYGVDASTIHGQSTGAAGHVAGGGSAVISGGGDNAVIV